MNNTEIAKQTLRDMSVVDNQGNIIEPYIDEDLLINIMLVFLYDIREKDK